LVAARAAGFVGCKDIRVIAEPEAAAICSLNPIQQYQLNVSDEAILHSSFIKTF